MGKSKITSEKKTHEINSHIDKSFVNKKRITEAYKKSTSILDTRAVKITTISIGKLPNITIFIGDVLFAAKFCTTSSFKNIAILDYASDSNPGGGWRSQQTGTQEESICRRSTLGLTLENAKYPISTYGAIFVQDVLILPDGTKSFDEIWCSVIAAALRGGSTGQFLQDKTDGILKIAISNNIKTLVLGSWGCGAFGNEVDAVVNAWKNSLAKYGSHIDNVVFSIMKNGKNSYTTIFPKATIIVQNNQYA